MKKTNHSTGNIFLIPLIVASVLILGALVYAGLKGTEIRSKAANPVVCKLAQKTDKGLFCPSGSSLKGNMCCSQPVPTPKPVCKTGVDSLCMNTSCRNGYRYATVTCLNGFSQKDGGATSCKTSAQWAFYGEDVCKNRPICSTPTPTKQPPPPTQKLTPPPTACTGLKDGSPCVDTCARACPPSAEICTEQCTTRKGFCMKQRCETWLTPTPTPIVSEKPYCSAQGTRSEGWYIKEKLIRYDQCGKCEATCGAIGSRSEGWYDCKGEVIQWTECAVLR